MVRFRILLPHVVFVTRILMYTSKLSPMAVFTVGVLPFLEQILQFQADSFLKAVAATEFGMVLNTLSNIRVDYLQMVGLVRYPVP